MTVFKFQPQPAARLPRPRMRQQTEPCRIIIFPGVRIEREGDLPDVKDEKRSRRRSPAKD